MRNLPAIFFIILFFNLSAQNNNTFVTGTVIDKESNTPLEYATISIFKNDESNIENVAISDINGKFKIKTSKDSFNIRIEYISFKKIIFENVEGNKNKERKDEGKKERQKETKEGRKK